MKDKIDLSTVALNLIKTLEKNSKGEFNISYSHGTDYVSGTFFSGDKNRTITIYEFHSLEEIKERCDVIRSCVADVKYAEDFVYRRNSELDKY